MPRFCRGPLPGLLVATAVIATPMAGAGAEVSAARTLARQLNEAFVEVAAQVAPSVVVINVVTKPKEASTAHPFLEFFPDELREQMERHFEEKREERSREKEGAPARPERPAPSDNGSGVVIRADGYILTNFHVVESAEQIRVKLSDGREFAAKLTGLDPKSDLAVIRLEEPPKDLRAAKFADSAAVRVGEFAIAIGAPFELEHSFTFGHISAKGRRDILPAWNRSAGGFDQDFLQTDASINPGNSGGPLVNLDGEVIGINSLIRGMGTGIGFAISSNLAKEVSAALIEHGAFIRSWLGIQIGSLRDNPDYAEMLKSVKAGVVVNGRVPDGPAAKSDLKDGDVITAVDGTPVTTPADLRSLVSRKRPGQAVALDVHRLGQELKIEVRPEAWPEESAVASARPRKAPAEPAEPLVLGLKVRSLTRDTARKFGVEVRPGVIVTEVEPDSLAAERGLKPGDIITEVNHEEVTSPKEFNAQIKRAKLKEGVLLNFVRGGEAGFRVLRERSE